MRIIKDILRLHFDVGLSNRAIAQSLGIGYGTVVDYLKRARQAKLCWPLPQELQERDLGRLLFPTQPATGQRRFAEPDFPYVHGELKRKGVTKQLFWQEYRQQHPDRKRGRPTHLLTDQNNNCIFNQRKATHTDEDIYAKGPQTPNFTRGHCLLPLHVPLRPSGVSLW